MLGDIRDTKPDIIKVWFDHIRQAPFGAGSKFDEILISHIRHGIQPETVIITQREWFLAIHHYPEGSYIDQVSEHFPGIRIQDQHIIGQAFPF
jgi:hypothetical protein